MQEQRRIIEQKQREAAQQKKVLRPKKANPYEDTGAQYWPILISIGIFLPTVILLCKFIFFFPTILKYIT